MCIFEYKSKITWNADIFESWFWTIFRIWRKLVTVSMLHHFAQPYRMVLRKQKAKKRRKIRQHALRRRCRSYYLMLWKYPNQSSDYHVSQGITTEICQFFVWMSTTDLPILVKTFGSSDSSLTAAAIFIAKKSSVRNVYGNLLAFRAIWWNSLWHG